MKQVETKVRTITLDEKDIQTAIKYYLKERNINGFPPEDVKLIRGHDSISASITITESNEPDK